MKQEKTKIISWRKNSHEIGFNAIVGNGECVFIEDHNTSMEIEVNDELTELTVEPIEFQKDYQWDVPEEKRDANKLDYSHVSKCKISGDSDQVNRLLYSIGWSNVQQHHYYKSPIVEDLKDEINNLKFAMEQLTKLIETSKPVEA